MGAEHVRFWVDLLGIEKQLVEANGEVTIAAFKRLKLMPVFFLWFDNGTSGWPGCYEDALHMRLSYFPLVTAIAILSYQIRKLRFFFLF